MVILVVRRGLRGVHRLCLMRLLALCSSSSSSSAASTIKASGWAFRPVMPLSITVEAGDVLLLVLVVPLSVRRSCLISVSLALGLSRVLSLVLPISTVLISALIPRSISVSSGESISARTSSSSSIVEG